METGLFEIQAEHLRDYRQNRQLLTDSRDVIHVVLRRADSDRNVKADNTVEFARCFLRLANLANFALDRLSRYEATLWRQVGRILFLRLMRWIGVNPRSEDAIVVAAHNRSCDSKSLQPGKSA